MRNLGVFQHFIVTEPIEKIICLWYNNRMITEEDNMKKQFWEDLLTALVTMVVASLLCLAASELALKIVDMFIEVDYFVGAIIKMVIAFLMFGGMIGAIHFFNGYKRVEFLPTRICGTVALGGVFHLALSILLVFHPMIAGGTRFLAGLIQMGDGFDSEAWVEYIYLWTYLAAFAIYLAFQIAVATACGYFGKKYRLYNRTQIKGYKENSEK